MERKNASVVEIVELENSEVEIIEQQNSPALEFNEENSNLQGELSGEVQKAVEITEKKSIARFPLHSSSSVLKETMIQPPKKTYLRKRKHLYQSFSESPRAREVSMNLDEDIQLFSCTDPDDSATNRNMNNFEKSEDRQSPVRDTVDSQASGIDDDLLFSSDIRSKGSVTYKRRKTSDIQNAQTPLSVTVEKEQQAQTPLSVAVEEEQQAQTPLSVDVEKEQQQGAVDEGAVKNANESSDSATASSRTRKSRKSISEKTKHVSNVSNNKKEQQQKLLNDVRKRKPVVDDIESDINKISSLPPKKPKTKPVYTVPESAFYPSTNVNFLKKAKLLKKTSRSPGKKQGKVGNPTKKRSSLDPATLNCPNGNLTEQQRNRLSEYNFSDSEGAPSDDISDVASYSSDSFLRKKRSRSLGSKIKSSEDSETWEKFLKSSPDKKRTTKYLTKLKRRAARLSVEDKSPPKSPNSESEKVNFTPLTQKDSKKNDSDPKEVDELCDEMPFLFNRPQMNIERQSQPCVLGTNFQCFNCDFETERVGNYITHLKSCLKSHEVNQNEVKDMARRQQIRGESQSFEEPPPPPVKAASESKRIVVSIYDEESSSDVDHESNRKNGAVEGFDYFVNEIVWVEWKRVVWPSLIRRIHPEEQKISVYFIDSPYRKRKKVCVKVGIKHVQSFNNAEINKKLLEEGRSKVHGETFVKAVQKAEDFVRKKILGVHVNSSQFFADQDVLTVVDGNSDSDDSEVETKEEIIVNELNNLVAKVLECIKGGELNDYLIGIFKETVESQRHAKFFSQDPVVQHELSLEPWFGPIGNLAKQRELYNYVFDLFLKKCKLDDRAVILRYVYEVWCPEAIVKAISHVRGIPAEDAEQIFKNGDGLMLRNVTFINNTR